MTEDQQRVGALINQQFKEAPGDVSSFDMYDFVVNRRGVDSAVYKSTRKAMGIKTYRVGNKWWMQNPDKDKAGHRSPSSRPLDSRLYDALSSQVGSLTWDEIKPALQLAIKQLKEDRRLVASLR